MRLAHLIANSDMRYCSSGPFENSHEEWTMFLAETEPEDWPEGSKLREQLSSCGSIPAEIMDEIITISERDGAVWGQCVCVTDEASETFVSPPWYVSFLFKTKGIIHMLTKAFLQ